MATLDELKVMIDAEIAPFKKKMKEVENQVKGTSDQVKNATAKVREQSNSIGSAFGKLAKFAVFAYLGKKLLDVGMYSAQTALEVSASMNQIKRQMGESSQSFLKWVNDNANAMNMGVGEATNYGAVYSNLFSGFIKDTNKLSAYTAKMLQTSAVVAEGSGRSITDVMERIRSGLLGNTEAIEDLGINVNVAMIQSTEAFKRFANDQSWNQLDYQTQQQIRLMAILEQATAKYGTTLSQSVNGRISLFKSLLKDSALNIGNAFLPIINAIMPVLNSFAMVLKNVTGKLAEFIALLFNKKATVKDSGVASAASGVGDALKDAAGGAGDLADAMDDADDASGGMADNLDDTAKSAKKAVKELLGLMGFDEINLLNKKEDPDDGDGTGKGRGGGGGKGKKGKGGGGGAPFKDILPEVELTDMDNQFKSIFDGLGDKLKGLFDYLAKLWDLFKQGFSLSFRWDSLERLKNALSGIWKSIKDIFEDGTVLQAAARFGEKLAFALGQTAGAIANVIMGIAVFLAESLNKSLNDTKWDIKSWLIRMFDINGDTIASIGNIAQSIGQIFYDTITSEPATNIGAGLISAFTYAFMGVNELVSKFTRDIVKQIEKVITGNQGNITEMFTDLLKAAEPVAEALARTIKSVYEKANRVYDEHIKPLIDKAGDSVSSIVKTFTTVWDEKIQPILEEIGAGFADTIENHIGPAVEKFLELLGSIADLIGVVYDKLEPLITFIIEKIINELAPSIQRVGNELKTFFDTLSDIVSGVIDIIKGIIDVITGIINGDMSKITEGFSSIFNGVLEIVVAIFKSLLNLIINILTNIWNTIISTFQSAWDGITNILGGAGDWFSNTFQGAWDAIANIFGDLGSWFGDRWSDVTNALSDVNTWLGDKFQQGWDTISNAFGKLGSWFGDRWNESKDALSEANTWLGEKFQSGRDNVNSTFENVGSWFSDRWNDIQSALREIPNWFRNLFNDAMENAKSIVKNGIDRLKSFFNFDWSLPRIKLPHFNISGSFSLMPPRIPSFSVDWYARGGVFNSPSIIGVGEAGQEAVMPLERNTGWISILAQKLAERMPVNNAPTSYPLPSGDIVIQIGGHEFGRVAIQEINREQERAGQVLLNI
nr:MAG TPA: minor tail protein [Caudoviricetes sp.]